MRVERDGLAARLVPLEARCARLESELDAVLEGRQAAQEELAAVRAAAEPAQPAAAVAEAVRHHRL